MTEVSPPAPVLADLVASSRGPELARVRTMLGAGQRGDGLRLMRIDAPAGAGATAVLDVIGDAWDGPVVALDARRGDGLGDSQAGGEDAIALDLRARSAARRLEQLVERGRVLVTIDHAWEDDVAATLYGALVDALDETVDVSVLLVRRVDAHREHDGGTWSATLDEIAHRRPVPGVELGVLSEKAIEELVRRLQPTRTALEVGRVVALSGGVPALAAMLAASVVELQPTLREWVEARLEGLEESARDSMLTLALVEEGLPAAALAVEPRMLPFSVQRANGDWGIEPPVVRAVLRDGASVARCRVVASEAEERLDGDAPEVLVARARLHELRGDRRGSRAMWTALASHLQQAGELEQAVVARRAAIRMSSSVQEQLESIAAAARTAREQGLRSPSEEALLELRRIATSVGDEELVAWSIRELAHARQDLDLLSEQTILTSSAGWAIEARAAAADTSGDYAAVAEHSAAALERARESGDELLELYALDRLLGVAALLPASNPHRRDASEAADELAQVVERAWELGSRHRALLSTWTEGYVLGMTARFDALAERMHARGELARDAGRPNHATILATYEAEGLREQGRLEDAAALLASLPDVDPGYDDGYSAAFVGLAQLALAVEVGTREEIRARHDALTASGTLELHSSLQGYSALIQLREALELEEPTAAAAAVAAFGAADIDDLATAAADAARTAMLRDSQVLLDAARALRARVPDERPSLPLVELALGEADACASGDPSALEAAIAAWRELGCELRALRLEVVAAHRIGEPSEDELRALKGRLRRAGMRGAEDAINARIRGLGGRAVAVAAPRGDAPLSNRELQVARLAVEGLTNAKIAERLGIQPATVARILANVYKRHGLRGRAALVGFIHELDRG